jgi:hypothetical protein
MNNFRNWYIRNQDAITWFIIGWLAMAGMTALAEGRYLWVAIDAALIWLNYSLIKARM